jgi:two-component system, OmpR family, response regulator
VVGAIGLEGKMGKILVVDDEPGIVRFLHRVLESDGHDVLVAADGAEALRMNSTHTPDLILLDVLMPGISGVGVLAAVLTENPAARVVVLSAMGDVETRARCLELGAADYLLKPFPITELLALVRERLRQPATTPAEPADELRCGAVRLNLRTGRLESGDVAVELSQREFALIQHLMLKAGDVCSRAELLGEVWGYSFDPGSNVVDVTIARLRAKFRALPIETVRNVGYLLRPA